MWTDTVVPTVIGVLVAVGAVVASSALVRWWNRDR
jgi:biopolymer transport protein ExbB/TolQ